LQPSAAAGAKAVCLPPLFFCVHIENRARNMV